MLAARRDLLGDGFEHDLGAAAEAMESGKCEQDTHLAMLDPNAGGTEQLAGGVKELGEAVAKLGFLAAGETPGRADEGAGKRGSAVDEHARARHAALGAAERRAVAVPEVYVQLVAEGDSLRRLVFIDEPAFGEADREA